MKENFDNKVVIAFNGGSYGTYLLWALDTLLTDKKIISPFNESEGNAHKFNSNTDAFIDITQEINFKQKILIPENCNLVRLHPKIHSSASLTENIDDVVNLFGKTILLYPTKSTYLLNIHNFLTKIWGDLHSSLLQIINLSDVYTGWPEARGIEFHNLPTWILREFMSYNLFPSWEDQVEWYFPDHYENENVDLITIEDILYDIKNTIERIKKKYDLNFIKSIDSLMPYHKKNLSFQKYLNQDKTCNKILNAFFNNEQLEWDKKNITVISESFIQKKMRDNGYEIKCHDLNVFPNTINDLKKIVV